ncbi:uncharacterized protein Z520_01991 [Fonsecaea multimorphosa CBS 102226]|uniref:Uncharacterized protein n=1 Tax=Fonsecaea multimorphosa CBS 102226 TaxID=1442371 RepID=A0A0D2K7C2_9EURO|nr:uncharacterized protein Z520_01991 [Fonsecaea multimorphosa CBS 102226]KIY01853.1 hypothetical protein Z520_01991 [Fonsecaea multimorphosa CBS 102226]OAL29537.1 hypothetical protein AYO22_01951 [Fonsecaea multimorphosa]
MAKGLDDLIEFLLEEIAVSGSQGLSISDIAQSISSFYDKPQDDSGSNVPTEGVDAISAVTVDRPLLAKVWSWLGRHPDVSIGDDRRYNETSLAEIELQFPHYLNLAAGHKQRSAEDDAASDGSTQPRATPKNRPRPGRARAVEGPRISVNEARVYEAICGHPPDISKVVPLEFELLSHIAAARSTGILQGDLVRASGQDKRSVPKRTDALQSKGYIAKEIVFRHGNRTSRLTLKKFAHHNAADAEPFHKLHSLPQHGSTLRDVVRRIFDVLEEHNLISQTRLAEELSLGSSAESAILSKIIRRLEKLKCIKRVRTAVGPSATSDDLRHFVQLLHRADAVDLENFDTEKLSLSQTVEELASSEPEDRNNQSASHFAAEEENEEASEAVYKPARWNPDRLMPNILVDAVRLAGLEGLTNLNARIMTTGDFVRRQLESLLLRLSCESLIIQPQHLRHLAIVRTTVRHDGVIQYVHFSWDVFRKKAADQRLDVSEIPGAHQIMKRLAEKEAVSDDHETSLSHAHVDELGFPIQAPLALQLRHGEATFYDLIKAAAPGDVQKRLGEPAIVKQGTKIAMKIRDELPVSSSTKNGTPRRLPRPPRQPTRRPPKRRRDSDDEEKTVIGRPRKYMRGTEKFWRMQFKQARLDAGADPNDLRKGAAQDPSAIALYARRPADFDKTLVQALEAGLPVPMLPEDINDDWIRSIRAIFDRSLEGIYMSPKGLRSDNSQRLAQIMIVKTPRLTSVDFSDRTIVHPFRFISSSASHSFMFRRYYPDLPTMHPSALRTLRKSKRQSEIGPSKREEKRKQGPRLGIFYEDPGLPTALPSQLPNPADIQLSVNVLMDTTDEENGPPSEGALGTRTSSRVSIDGTILSDDTRIENGEASKGSQWRIQERDASAETPTAPNSKPEITEPRRARSARNRKLTRKAMELLQSDQTRNVRVFSESRETPSEVFAADSELQNQMSLHRASEVSSAEAPSHSSSHSPMKEHSTGISYLNVDETRTAHYTQPSVSSDKHMIIDVNPSVGETEATRTLSVEREQPEYPVSARFLEGITEAAASKSPSLSEQLPENNHSAEGQDNFSQKRSFPSKAATRKRLSTPTRARTASVEAGNAEDESQPKNRQSQGKQRYFEGANALFRRIILQLIQETSGVVPNDASMFKRVALPRWQEAGGEGRPLLKTIKTAIKSLNESRRLKQVMFTFRGKSGIMVTRSVIFLPHIDPLSQAVEEVKQNIINAEPTDYIPPEWRDEGYRIPLVNKRAPSRTPDVEEEPPRSRRASSAVSKRRIASTSSRGERSRTKTTESSPSPMTETPAGSFLTLRVPALGSLPIVHLHNWRKECPVSALRSDTSDANPWKAGAFRPIRRRRRFEQQGSQAAGRSIIWRNFPSSLEDILQLPDLRLDYDAFQADDADWQRFACEIEGVRAWEEQEPGAALSKRSRFAFINHSVPAALYAGSVFPLAIEFSSLVQFDEDGSELEVAYPPAETWAAFANALQASSSVTSRIVAVDEANLHSMRPLSPGLGPRRSKRPSKRRLSEDDHGFIPLPPSKRRRRARRVSDTTPSRRTGISAFGNTTRKLPKSAKWLQTMPEEMIYRIAVAVIVVRTLAGGMQSFINWHIVMTLFPDQKEEVIKARWNTLSTRYSSDIQNLTEDLQSRYLEALQAGEVASVGFDVIEATDWGAIVDWALESVDRFNLKRIAHLPANRGELLDSYALEFTQPRYFHNTVWNNSTTNVKEDAARSTVFATHANSTMQSAILRHQHGFELEMAKPALRVAKSWVLATVFTPESVFNAELAQAKLSTLALNPVECDALLSRALKLLQDEKIIQRKLNAHQLEQGLHRVRTWEAHRKFLHQFEERGMVTPDVLRCAAKYKLEVLDHEFARGNSVPIEKEELVPDGKMVAVLNLMASGRVRVRPGADVPKTRYGLDHERVGYRTKDLDKKLLGFGIELTPTKEYPSGDPWSGALGIRQLPIPRGQADEPMGPIPIWVDIHGNVQAALWYTFLVGVIGLVSQMPGVSASQISRTFGFGLDEAEVELIMQWCVQSGFAKMDTSSKGYETLEWWWLCVDEARA